jgi:hypothetical protein
MIPSCMFLKAHMLNSARYASKGYLHASTCCLAGSTDKKVAESPEGSSART